MRYNSCIDLRNGGFGASATDIDLHYRAGPRSGGWRRRRTSTTASLTPTRCASTRSSPRSRMWRWWSWGATPWRPGTSRRCRPSTATARRASTICWFDGMPWYFSPLPAEYSNCKARVYYCLGLEVHALVLLAAAGRVQQCTMLLHEKSMPWYLSRLPAEYSNCKARVFYFCCTEMHALILLAPAGRVQQLQGARLPFCCRELHVDGHARVHVTSRPGPPAAPSSMLAPLRQGLS